MESSCLTARPRTETASAVTMAGATGTPLSLLDDIAAAGPGQPLPTGQRLRLERAFNADLTEVRVHTGPAADRLAHVLQADAFACGSGIFFRDGSYRPGTRSGAWLLAHEVAHVVQQARAAAGGTAPTAGLTVSAPGDPAERAADAQATRALAGQAATGADQPAVVVRAGPSRWIQRHVSFEHRYLGDGPTADLVAISNRTGDWQKLVQQQVVSCFAIFRERSIDNDSEEDVATGELSTEQLADGTSRTLEGIAPGMELTGRPGEKLQGFSPNVPNAEFFQHVRLILTLVGVNLGLPLCIVMLDGSETNFSGWRGALDQAKMGFRHNQRWLIDRLTPLATKPA